MAQNFRSPTTYADVWTWSPETMNAPIKSWNFDLTSQELHFPRLTCSGARNFDLTCEGGLKKGPLVLVRFVRHDWWCVDSGLQVVSIAVFPELLCVGFLAHHIGLFTNMKKEFPKYFTPFRVPTYHTLKLVRLSLALLASCFLGALPLARYSWTSLDRRLY